MLGGSSGINYLAYVRGPPRRLRRLGGRRAQGWSHADVLPYFKKSEGLQPSGDIVVDHDAHNPDGPLGVSVRSAGRSRARSSSWTPPRRRASPPGDYNGRDRLRPGGRGVAVPDDDQGTASGPRPSTPSSSR
jgi:hypothetical protein